MITEKILRSNPALIKALTGLPADEFWRLIAEMEAKEPEYERQRHERPDRQRAVGAGHPCAQWEIVGEEEVLTEEEILEQEQLADGRALVDATEQPVYRSQDNEERKKYYSGKKKAFTLKTEFVTDGEHHILAISEAAPGLRMTRSSVMRLERWNTPSCSDRAFLPF